MKGTNRIYFNKATVIDALQEYLNRRLVRNDSEVTDVFFNKDEGNFIVVISEKPKEEANDN